MGSKEQQSLTLDSSIVRSVKTLQFCSSCIAEFKYEAASDSYTKAQFWKSLDDGVILLSHEVTKLGLSFAKPPLPTPEEADKLISKFEEVATNLMNVFVKVPPELGKSVLKEITLSLIVLYDALLTFIKGILKQNESDILRAAGKVYEKCDAVQALPKDNKQAALSSFKEQYSIVTDAMDELVQSINAEEDDPPEIINGFSIPSHCPWSEEEKLHMDAIHGLVKCAKTSMKKVLSAISKHADPNLPDHCDALDSLVLLALEFSAKVDDLVSECSPPLDFGIIETTSLALGKEIARLLLSLRDSPLAQDEDQKWITFMLNATKHNLNKITSLEMDLQNLTLAES